MNLKEMQKTKKEFEKKRRWDRHRASNVFVHLVEEIGEIGRHINYEEGYKEKGKNSPDISRKELEREFAQTLMLLLQLANHYDIDLEKAFASELKIMEKRFQK